MPQCSCFDKAEKESLQVILDNLQVDYEEHSRNAPHELARFEKQGYARDFINQQAVFFNKLGREYEDAMRLTKSLVKLPICQPPITTGEYFEIY